MEELPRSGRDKLIKDTYVRGRVNIDKGNTNSEGAMLR